MKESATFNKDYGFAEKEADPTVSVFIPAAGYRDGSSISDVGSYCYLSSSSLYLDSPTNAFPFYFTSDDIG